jgi:hypothetical protein
MNVRNPCLLAVIVELANAGIHHPEIARGSKHVQVRWSTRTGERRMFAVPGTPSDWRSPENTRRDVRRILRADGMIETPEPRTPPPRQPSRIELLEQRLAEIERLLGIRNKEVA